MDCCIVKVLPNANLLAFHAVLDSDTDNLFRVEWSRGKNPNTLRYAYPRFALVPPMILLQQGAC